MAEKSAPSSEQESIGSSQSIEKLGHKRSDSTGSSPWSKGLWNKEYVNSTLKSAATSMATRFSELKTNLSTPGKPVTSSSVSASTGGGGGGSSFFTQWASLVAEKLPSNFSADDDYDDSSLSSFENRRQSMALSEEDLASCEQCRPKGTQASIPFFELIENHYSEILGEAKAEEILIQIEMTSCCRCHSCSCLVF